tara:strand:- start:952 stop:1200 length:249 start_codon:yes stop_codon:yes gene_type:complete
METQSVLISKKYLSEKKAKEWIKKNGYKLKKIDVTENLYRFRQLPPSHFDEKTFRIKVLKTNKNKDRLIMLVVGKKKKRQSY